MMIIIIINRQVQQTNILIQFTIFLPSVVSSGIYYIDQISVKKRKPSKLLFIYNGYSVSSLIKKIHKLPS